jgi:hypothetical protein
MVRKAAPQQGRLEDGLTSQGGSQRPVLNQTTPAGTASPRTAVA